MVHRSVKVAVAIREGRGLNLVIHEAERHRIWIMSNCPAQCLLTSNLLFLFLFLDIGDFDITVSSSQCGCDLPSSVNLTLNRQRPIPSLSIRFEPQSVASNLQITHRERLSLRSAAKLRIVAVVAVAVIGGLPLNVEPIGIREEHRSVKGAVAIREGHGLNLFVLEIERYGIWTVSN